MIQDVHTSDATRAASRDATAAPLAERVELVAAASESAELSDDQLEHVVGGLARVWSEWLPTPWPVGGHDFDPRLQLPS